MRNSIEKVKTVAALARIDLTAGLPPGEEEKTLELFAGQFDAIVALMDTLEEVDVQGVEPLYWPLAEGVSPLREDVAKRCNTREELLANAPEQDGRFFIVPRIV